MYEKPDLAALIGSRICHDLISPIGAIGNGVELLMMDGAAQSPELALIAESVANANARIRFFRVAFGAASKDQRISSSEVISIIEDMTRGGRLNISWLAPSDNSRRHVKLVFLLLQCLETAMPWGGKIIIRQEDGTNNAGWRISAQAPRLRNQPELWEPLSNGTPLGNVAAGQVHFALVPEELRNQNLTLSCRISEEDIQMAF